MNYNFDEVFRGFPYTFNLTFTNNGAVLDITSYIIKFMVKNNVNDTDANAVFTVTVNPPTDPTNGKTAVNITSANNSIDCKAYYYQLIYLDASSNKNNIIDGIYNVVPPVIRS